MQDIRYAAQNYPFFRRVFLADGDALIIPQPKTDLDVCAASGKKCRRFSAWGCMAMPRAFCARPPRSWQELRDLGLGIVYLGLESGDPQVLREINKGVAPERMVEAAGGCATRG